MIFKQQFQLSLMEEFPGSYKQYASERAASKLGIEISKEIGFKKKSGGRVDTYTLEMAGFELRKWNQFLDKLARIEGYNDMLKDLEELENKEHGK